jgi:hypothetical protein
MGDIEIETYRARESRHVIVQTVVDWALFLAVPGAVLGHAAGWGILWPLTACAGSGATLGLLYALRVNGVRARGAERLDFAWTAQRKRDELEKLLKDSAELEEALSRGNA